MCSIVGFMTDKKREGVRRVSALPTGTGLDLLVAWANEGPWNLAPLLSEPGDTKALSKRSHVLRELRRLAVTLDVPESETKELRLVHDRDFGDLSVELLGALARRARARGYVTAGCRERVPMTPVQVDGLHRIAWGATFQEIADETGVQPTGVSGALKRARNDHGCSTTYQLVACAYRNGWLPGHEELRTLLSGRMVWSVPVHNPLPPYLWRDNG